VKLLFDQNLSPKLVASLADLFPHSSHVHFLGLGQAEDEVIWQHAHDQGFTLVTKDADYESLAVVRGTPPKVIWIRLGNCSTSQIEALLRDRFLEINAFASNLNLSTLVLT
jgi:predicted nuclease of predicted toxin-antitoxin system